MLPEPRPPSLRRETLHALVVDDACGQLPREVSELLAVWLAVEPEDAREAQGIRSAVQLARSACRSAAGPAPGRRERWVSASMAAAFAVAASVAVMLASSQPMPQHGEAYAVQPPAIRWTRYDLATDGRGGLALRPRVDPASTP